MPTKRTVHPIPLSPSLFTKLHTNSNSFKSMNCSESINRKKATLSFDLFLLSLGKNPKLKLSVDTKLTIFDFKKINRILNLIEICWKYCPQLVEREKSQNHPTNQVQQPVHFFMGSQFCYATLSTWGVEYAGCLFVYNTKPSHVEAPILELWGMWSSSSLLSLIRGSSTC